MYVELSLLKLEIKMRIGNREPDVRDLIQEDVVDKLLVLGIKVMILLLLLMQWMVDLEQLEEMVQDGHLEIL